MIRLPFFLLLFVGMSLNARAQPTTISYQGILNDNAGSPINGTVSMTFALYTIAEEGDTIWSETHPGVTVADGVYGVQLGSVIPFGSSVDFNQLLYLGVNVNAAGELQPRTALSAVPYALAVKLPITGSASVGTPGAAISVENTGSGDGIQVVAAGDDGLAVGTAGDNGLTIVSAGGYGVDVQSAGGTGVRVQSAGSPSTTIGGLGLTGFEVAGAEEDGLYVGRADKRGVAVSSAGLEGVYIQSAGTDGVSIVGANDDGLKVGQAGSPSTSTASTRSNGVEVAGAEGYGLYVGRADQQGLYIGSAGADGVFIDNAEDAGVEVNFSEGDGVFVYEAGSPSTRVRSLLFNNGFEVAGAEGYGLFVGNADEDGVHVFDAGNNGIYVGDAGGDGIRVDGADGHSLNIIGQKNGIGFASGDHVAHIENSSLTTTNGPDVLALRTSVASPGTDTNFITFFDGNGLPLGSVEGNGDGGVAYNTSGADYAEYLQHLDEGDRFEAGDVVGVFHGKISHRTTGADQVLVITDRPAVLGNAPRGREADGHEKASFLGQVPTNVSGAVTAGDYIIASGNEDGLGRAVSPTDIDLADLPLVVGRSWQSSQVPGVNRINVAVGLDRSEVLMHIVSRQAEQLVRNRSELDTLRSMVEELLRRAEL